MEKIKKFKISNLFNLIKCSMIGIVVTLIVTVLFALILKFANLSNVVISYVNDLIKVLSIFIMILCVKKSGADRLFFKALFAGIIYELLSFIIFSILNGGFNFDITFIYDLLFALIVSAIVTVIINVLNRKSM